MNTETFSENDDEKVENVSLKLEDMDIDIHEDITEEN